MFRWNASSIAAAGVLAAVCLAPAVRAQEPSPAEKLIREMKEDYDRKLAEVRSAYESRIAALEGRVAGLSQETQAAREKASDEALEAAIREAEASDAVEAKIAASPPSPGSLQLVDLSLDILFAAGASSERDVSLDTLQGGGHDPRKRGFTVQNVELSLIGAVDPYFTAEMHLVTFLDPFEGETVVELEEAFATTQSLPGGLQVEAGTFFTEFGRLNPRHPHAWEFIDQPVVNSRFFGPDGLRGPGVRVGWLTPLPWYSELHAGLQNANGETMASFLANDEFFAERPVGGRPFNDREVRAFDDLLALVRWDNGFELSDEIGMKAGASALFGPNATGPDGRTWILGADLLLKWRPSDHFRGWPFVAWQSEVMYRSYTADDFFDARDPADPLDDLFIRGDRLEDWGFYSQVLWGFSHGWAAGVRYEFAGGDGPGYDLGAGTFISRNADPFRDDRHRASLLLVHHPSHFSRLRLQYNWDHAEHLAGDDAHSVWLGLEVLLGKHPAHEY